MGLGGPWRGGQSARAGEGSCVTACNCMHMAVGVPWGPQASSGYLCGCECGPPPCLRLLPVSQSRGCAMGSSMHRSLVSVLQHCVEVVCLPSKVGGGGVLGAAALWLGGGRGE